VASAEEEKKDRDSITELANTALVVVWRTPVGSELLTGLDC
jgi:hypothetical protein